MHEAVRRKRRWRTVHWNVRFGRGTFVGKVFLIVSENTKEERKNEK